MNNILEMVRAFLSRAKNHVDAGVAWSSALRVAEEEMVDEGIHPYLVFEVWDYAESALHHYLPGAKTWRGGHETGNGVFCWNAQAFCNDDVLAIWERWVADLVKPNSTLQQLQNKLEPVEYEAVPVGSLWGVRSKFSGEFAKGWLGRGQLGFDEVKARQYAEHLTIAYRLESGLPDKAPYLRSCEFRRGKGTWRVPKLESPG